MMATLANDSSKKALILGTVAFSISFALWGLLSGLMPILKAQLSLSSVQASLLVAIPVVLGSLGRIPIGIASDRFGGKKVFLFVMTAAILPVIGLGFARDYTSFLFLAALLGVAGTSFAVGVTFVSRWYANQNQGTILGIYGVGNIGQSIAVFGAPAL
ncbi:MAG TPA: MFS transporter, partial [Candidatus Obscuribacterales bacterium]